MKTQEERPLTTMQVGMDVCADGVAADGGVSRRGFLGGMGAMMAGAALACGGVSAAFADEAEEKAEDETEEAEEQTTVSTLTGWTGTPEEVLALGVSTMPLDDLNEYRRQYVDSQVDWECADGTIVPACYVKVRALIHSYGQGCGNTPLDAGFDELLRVFSEDDCQAFIDMPWGVEFTAFEMAVKTGRDVDECSEICERLASEGFLHAYDGNRGRIFHQCAWFQGVAEYQFNKAVEQYDTYVVACVGADTGFDTANNGTPTFYYVPVDYSVTSDGTIYPIDDLRKKLMSKSLVAICPCACRYPELVASIGLENAPSFEDFATGEYEDYMSPVNGLRVETCIMTGDEAAYWIERGFGRQITPEQAVEYLERSVEDGFMLESTFGKNTDTICSCHADKCNILAGWLALGDAETIAATPAFQQVSHYRLEVDPDKCIACGLCVDRCPMHIISINDEGWAEPAANCFRCGQCAYVCPQGARQLVLRDESEFAPLPQSMLDDANVKAAYRFEKGLIF